MKTYKNFIIILIITSMTNCSLDSEPVNITVDEVETFLDLTDQLTKDAEDPLLRLHFQSMRKIIEAKRYLSASDVSHIAKTLEVFENTDDDGSASNPSAYYERKRPLVIAWTSPSDLQVSYTRIILPKDYDPEKTYPMYVDLHGFWEVAENPIDFMTYPFRHGPSSSFAYEDGFLLSMWGRGNYWYRNFSETDIWEGIEVIENLVNIDPKKRFITGHSMGGYGAWYISSKTPDYWAGIGVHAGALYYGMDYMLTGSIIASLSNMPVYITCGTSDQFYDVNRQAFDLLKAANNENIKFVPFPGGHDYIQENVENMYLWLKDFKRE